MDKRKTNLDLLRIYAMFGIVVFHHFGNRTLNYIVELSDGFTTDSYFYDFVNNTSLSGGHVSKLSLLMDFCYGHFGDGGNIIFMLITGYFLFGRDISFPKRVRTVAGILYAILFHGIILTLINGFLLVKFYPFSSYSIYKPLFTLPNWFSGDNLWYLQAYGCFILVVLPLLKLFEERLTQTTHLCLALSLTFIFFLQYNTYLPHLWLSTRIVQFTAFYYVGGYIRRSNVRIKPGSLLIIALAYLLAYFSYEYYWRFSCSILYEPSQYSYISVMQPFICSLIYGVVCFLIFNQIKVPESFSKIISTVAGKTIGIYIFHYNIMNISYIAAGYFGWNDWSGKGYFLFAIVDSIVLFTAGFLIDTVRQWSYKRIEQKVLGERGK